MNKSSLPQDVRWSAPAVPQVNLLHGGQPTNPPLPASLPATKIKLSLSQLTTLRWSLLEEVLQLKASGYDGIGLWRPKIAEFGEELAAHLLSDAGLEVSSLSFVGGFTGVNGFGYEEALDDARAAIADAELLGAENVIVVGGARNGHTLRHSRRLVTDALCELAEFAQLRGVKLSLLPMHSFFSPNWTYLNTLDETLELLGVVDHPSVALAFDTYHLWQEPRLLQRIPELAPFTGIVQVGDARRAPQSDSDRCFPGEGIIPLDGIIREFQRAGYTGYFDVQVWTAEGWSAHYPDVATKCRETLLRCARQPLTV